MLTDGKNLNYIKMDKLFIELGEKNGHAQVLSYAKQLVSANDTDGTCEDQHAGECGVCKDNVFYPCVEPPQES